MRERARNGRPRRQGRVRALGAVLAAAVLGAVVWVVPAPAAWAEGSLFVSSWAELVQAVDSFNNPVNPLSDDDLVVYVIADLSQGGGANLPDVGNTKGKRLTIAGAAGVAVTPVPQVRAITGNSSRFLLGTTAGDVVLRDLTVTGFSGLEDLNVQPPQRLCRGALARMTGTGALVLEGVHATFPGGACTYSRFAFGDTGAEGGLVSSSSAPVTIRNSTLRRSDLSGAVKAASVNGVVIGGLVYAGAVTIEGSGLTASGEGVRGSQIRGGTVSSQGATTITGGSVVTGGFVTAGPGELEREIQGAAVFSGGSLVLDGSTVRDTFATDTGEGTTSRIRGTVYVADSAVLRNGARLAGNTMQGSDVQGGGLYADANGTVSVTVTESTVEANVVRGVEVAGGGGIWADGDVSLLRSTVLDNAVEGLEEVLGGGVQATGTVTVDDSTVFANTARERPSAVVGPGKDPAQVIEGGGVSAGDSVQLRFATVQGNAPDQLRVESLRVGGGEGPAKSGSGGASVASVVVGSCSGLPLASSGWNFSETGNTSCWVPVGTDVQGASPGLSPSPALNGGVTVNFLPLAGSPLIDGVSSAGCASVDAGVRTPDQRGVSRPQGVDGACDIGSVEVVQSTPTTTTTTPGGGGGSGTPSPPGASVSRVYGETASGTAVSLSLRSFPSGAVVVFVATRASFADGLVGGVPAGLLPGPLLLVDVDGVPAETVAEIRRLGATHVIVLGGPQAVSDAIYAELAALIGASAQAGSVRAGQEAPRIERWAGPDRYATADVVAANAFPEGASRAFLATGEDFPDALAVVPAAISARGPVLLTLRDALPEATAQQLVALGVTRVTIVGGPEAVSEEVEAQVRALGFEVDRIAGPDRYATAAAIGLLRRSAPTSWVASGLTFPDALAAGPVAGRAGQPLLLVSDVVPSPTSEALRALGTRTILVAGGPMAVSDSVVAALAATG